MTDPVLKLVELKPCPFCGGEASADGRTTYSSPMENTWWADGSPITETFNVNCMRCGASPTGGVVHGFQTREKAVTAWNRRTALAAYKAAPGGDLCTCLSELAEDAYGPGGPMSGQLKPPRCIIHSPRASTPPAITNTGDAS